MNVECGKAELDELNASFRFSDAVIRNMIVAMPAAVTEASPMAKAEEEGGRVEESTLPEATDDDRRDRRDRGDRGDRSSD